MKFLDGRYIDGIAYRDEIICGCCGGTFRINDIYKAAPDTFDNDPIIILNGWKTIKYDICGGDN